MPPRRALPTGSSPSTSGDPRPWSPAWPACFRFRPPPRPDPSTPDRAAAARPLGAPMALPKTFQSFAEFEREIIRPNNRIGLSLEDIVEDTSFDAEIEVDNDPFESMR